DRRGRGRNWSLFFEADRQLPADPTGRCALPRLRQGTRAPRRPRPGRRACVTTAATPMTETVPAAARELAELNERRAHLSLDVIAGNEVATRELADVEDRIARLSHDLELAELARAEQERR